MSFFEDFSGLNHYSMITSRYLAQKKGDTKAFMISCTIGTSRFSIALYDLGANINLIPMAVLNSWA